MGPHVKSFKEKKKKITYSYIPGKPREADRGRSPKATDPLRKSFDTMVLCVTLYWNVLITKRSLQNLCPGAPKHCLVLVLKND